MVLLCMVINFVLGKNGGHRPSSLGGRSIVVVSEWDKMLAVFKNFKIRQARLSCLNEFMVLKVS